MAARRFVPSSRHHHSALLVLFLGIWGGCSEVSDLQTASESSSPAAAAVVVLDDRRIDLGLQLLSGGGHAEAQAAFEAVLADHPDHPRPVFLRAVAIQKQGNYAVALGILDDLRLESREFSGRDSIQHFRGWCLFYLGRPRESQVAFADHLEIVPRSPDSAFGRGVSLLEIGDPQAALTSLDLALELEAAGANRRRSIGKTWIRRGDALWELGRFEEATRSFHKGVIQFSDHYEGWSKLSRGHARLGDPSKAAWAAGEARNARIRVGAPVDEDPPGSEEGG